MIIGRKETSKNLEIKLELLKNMTDFLMNDIKKINHYKHSSSELEYSAIDESNIEKVFKVLKSLATTDQIQYETRIINFPAYDSIDIQGYRKTQKYNGKIIILAEKKALSKLDYSTSLTQEALIDIYNQGFSMVLHGNDEYMTERLNIDNKQVLGHYKPIIFYLHDDKLALAIESFINFIKDNGPDLNNINANDLIENIKMKYQESNVQKKMTKNT